MAGMALILPRPTDVVRWTTRTATTVLAVPGRVLALLTAAEAVVARADELVRRTDRVLTDSEGAMTRVRRVTDESAALVAAARPLLEFVEEFSAHEVTAAIKLVDELPRLSRHLTEDVLPILGTLQQVGPDLHELLEVANDVRQAILGIPGFEFLRRRGEDKEEERED
jgi:hypothetical protein